MELFEISLKASYIAVKNRDKIPMVLIYFTFNSLSKAVHEVRNIGIAILVLKG